jgi:4a-hydroxytetrahydrobiopterin dehydratase
MNSDSLASRRCIPCEGDIKPYTKEWTVIEDKKLERIFEFKNFKEALLFVNKVGAIAETEGHHPDIYLHNWNKVTIMLWTHAISGLFLNDFILAAKIDKINE